MSFAPPTESASDSPSVPMWVRWLLIALLVSLFFPGPGLGQQYIPDSLVVEPWEEPPQMHPDSLSYLIRVDDLRQIEPPANWRRRWHEVAVCLNAHDIRRLPVDFDDYTFWTYRWAQTSKSVISDLRGLHVGPQPPLQIYVRSDHIDDGTVEHEFVHAQCGDDERCEHCSDIFRACVGFVQNWCD